MVDLGEASLVYLGYLCVDEVDVELRLTQRLHISQELSPLLYLVQNCNMNKQVNVITEQRGDDSSELKCCVFFSPASPS